MQPVVDAAAESAVGRSTTLAGRCNPLASGNAVSAVALVILLFCAATTIELAQRRPLTSHEIFVARSATEMEARGDWLVPYFNGAPRLQKPPLNAWLAATAHRILGTAGTPVTELESRLPSYLCAIGLVIVAFLIGREIGDQRVATIAGAIAATSFGVFRFANSARPEMSYALFTAMEILALVRLRKSLDQGGTRTSDALLLWGSFCGAMLAKGPFLPVFVLLGAIVSLIVERRARSIVAMLRPVWAIPAVALAAAWFVAAAVRTPGAYDLWRHQMFDRVGDESPGGLAKHIGTLYYLYATPLLVVPWIALLPSALGYRFFRNVPRPAGASLLWWSVIAPAFFLSLAERGHEFYMLPVLPSLAVLMAWSLVALVDSGTGAWTRRAVTIGIVAHAILTFLAVIAAGIIAIDFQPGTPFGLTHAGASALGMATAALSVAAAIVAAFQAGVRPVRAVLALAAAFACATAALSDAEIGSSPEREPAKLFALAVKEQVPPGAEMVALEPVDAAPVIYYADRIVPEVNLEQLEARHDAHPGLVAIMRRKALQEGKVAGSILCAEPVEDDPRVLVGDLRIRK